MLVFVCVMKWESLLSHLKKIIYCEMKRLLQTHLLLVESVKVRKVSVCQRWCPHIALTLCVRVCVCGTCGHTHVPMKPVISPQTQKLTFFCCRAELQKYFVPQKKARWAWPRSPSCKVSHTHTRRHTHITHTHRHTDMQTFILLVLTSQQFSPSVSDGLYLHVCCGPAHQVRANQVWFQWSN